MPDVYRLLRELEEQRGQVPCGATSHRPAAAALYQQSFQLERELCAFIQEIEAVRGALLAADASSSKYRRLAEDALELAEQLRDDNERSVVLEVAAAFARVAARYERQERTARPG